MPDHHRVSSPSAPAAVSSASSASDFVRRLLDFFRLNDALSPSAPILRPLFLASFACLYIEILLIRWIGTEIGVFAFFQNLALIACFLGFGFGCYQANAKKTSLLDAGALSALLVIVSIPFEPYRRFLFLISNSLAISPDANFWGGDWGGADRTSIIAVVILSFAIISALLIFLIATMIPLGRWVGFYLDRAPDPVAAYSFNLLGSLAGIWVFAALAFVWTPPLVWIAIAVLMYYLIRPPAWRFSWGIALLLAIALIFISIHPAAIIQTIWSPYQKLTIEQVDKLGFEVRVNNRGYMSLANLTPSITAADSDYQGYLGNDSYDAPFRFITKCDRLLIVGAGGGNDADAALRNCHGQIDAVEIDPAIYHIGVALHPMHPYDSPRVHVVLNDARAFFRSSREKYNVIVFGLLDSHTNYSSFSNMRIDNYVYTQQSFEEARNLLTPTGVLILKFEVRDPWTWMGVRFYSELTHAFGRAPVVYHIRQYGALFPATEFLASNDPSLWQRAQSPDLAAFIARNPPGFALDSGTPPPATDDWPYVYHPAHTIPRTFLSVSLLLLVIAILLVRKSFQVRSVSTWLFFFLGAGFLLMETQMVMRLALYFGTTWMVNCIALSAILLVLVAANLFLERAHPKNLGIYIALLIATLIADYLIPWHSLPLSAHAVGAILAAAYSIPIFLAGIVFTELFRRSESRSPAFAANILGAVAGGLAQNFSFIVGLKALLLIAALFYLAASLCLFANGSRRVAHSIN